ncbi:amidase [Candidimonas sp. SYP-B2681]|uniref:amidase n=1 Tax=Candidimonas sp. SYP-B2681 TaxID=2497686 RepID=UPI000F86C978|nr:amidase [Candidimonas sp. SYP-B2681]RTZ41687.1 amidase [Candidimonas sp. SYP-B2681]
MSAVPDILQRFERAADGVAALNRYPFADRRKAWAERLGVNLPELELLDGFIDGGSCQYVASANAVESDGIGPPDDAVGMASIARAAHRKESNILDPALQALQAATQHAHLNAFIQLASDVQLAEQARAAGSASKAGMAQALLGVPIGVKDLMAVKGFALTGGTKGGSAQRSSKNALAVSRLRDAGALIIGTTNLHELAYGITSENPHYGFVGNPRGLGFIAGGSSGGSAAVVAAGIVGAAVGTDTAGSIRIPAACCGVVGFKPSYDVIPRQGAMDLGATLDHLGPIARSVDDAALLFSVMAGLPAQVPQRLSSLKGMRIGVPSNYFFEPLAPDVLRAMNDAMDRMRADGAELVPITLPGMENSAALQFVTLCSEATAVHWQRLVHRPETLGADVRVRLEIGQFFPAIWYTRAQGIRTALAAMFQSTMAGIDVLITPTLRTTAPASGTKSLIVGQQEMPLHAAMTSLTLPFNLTGMPALSMPCGLGVNGLPVGLQLAGARSDDWKVLAVAARVERLVRSDESFI